MTPKSATPLPQNLEEPPRSPCALLPYQHGSPLVIELSHQLIAIGSRKGCNGRLLPLIRVLIGAHIRGASREALSNSLTAPSICRTMTAVGAQE